MEDRNKLRTVTDHIHKVLGVLTAIAVGWIFLTTHNNDKASDVLLSKLTSFEHTIILIQANQTRTEKRVNQLESYLPRIDERTKYIQSSAKKIEDRIDHLTQNQHEFMPIVYEAQRFMREKSK